MKYTNQELDDNSTRKVIQVVYLNLFGQYRDDSVQNNDRHYLYYSRET